MIAEIVHTTPQKARALTVRKMCMVSSQPASGQSQRHRVRQERAVQQEPNRQTPRRCIHLLVPRINTKMIALSKQGVDGITIINVSRVHREKWLYEQETAGLVAVMTHMEHAKLLKWRMAEKRVYQRNIWNIMQ